MYKNIKSIVTTIPDYELRIFADIKSAKIYSFTRSCKVRDCLAIEKLPSEQMQIANGIISFAYKNIEMGETFPFSIKRIEGSEDFSIKIKGLKAFNVTPVKTGFDKSPVNFGDITNGVVLHLYTLFRGLY